MCQNKLRLEFLKWRISNGGFVQNDYYIALCWKWNKDSFEKEAC